MDHPVLMPTISSASWSLQSPNPPTNVVPTTKFINSYPQSIHDIVEYKFDPDRIPPRRTPTHHACDHTQGILHIAMGDIGGAAGTILFQFVIGQLIYAERNQLTPWVHLNNVSYIVYDPLVHGQGPGVSLQAHGGRNATRLSIAPAGQRHWRDQYPGPLDASQPVQLREYHFPGTGVWEHYFEPVSDFVPGDQSCARQLYVTLDLFLITPGIHGFAPWAPRCWRYHYLPEYMTRPYESLQTWLAPARQQGHAAVHKYIRFRPYLLKQAHTVNANCSLAHPCLGMHIRHSDKAAGRRVVATEEFLPYAKAFVHAGGQWIYVATDSTLVLQEIQSTWPLYIQQRIRTLDDHFHTIHTPIASKSIVRSSNGTAVFDIGSHHVTNQQVLVEILALSQCQFLIHGLSAVSEAAIWIHLDLHERSVNLEDPLRWSAPVFGTLVQMTLRDTYSWVDRNPLHARMFWADAWQDAAQTARDHVTHTACEGKAGVLHISTAGREAMWSGALFTSIVNQIMYAERHNLLPWVHLLPEASPHLYDPLVHGQMNTTVEMMFGMGIRWIRSVYDNSVVLPGEPKMRSDKMQLRSFAFQGNGIWDTYLEPASDFRVDDLSCRIKPIIAMDEKLMGRKGVNTHDTHAIRPWRYDDTPAELWNFNNLPLKEFMAPMRRTGHEIVRKYFRFHPYLQKRADQVNPVRPGESCLAIHLRNGDKKGIYRSKVKVLAFLEYIQSYVQAGGTSIYVASDSHRTIQFMEKNVPPIVQAMMHTQGSDVVRTLKEYPTHLIEDHHRVNSETIVDILAMAKCRFLLHTYSTTSEAAIYLNPDLHENSVNLEDAGRIQPLAFRNLVQAELQKHPFHPPEPPAPKITKAPVQGRIESTVLLNTTVMYRKHVRKCRTNAIVYLAQKNHSSYGRDSYNNLLKSLDLLHTHYLSYHDHFNNTDLYIFHTGDFTQVDLESLEVRLGPSSRGAIRLVNLAHSHYWERPSVVEQDDPTYWLAYPLFSEGYRRMMSWFAVELWDYFESLNHVTHCHYRYILRLDEDSFLHSPIPYDMFDMVQRNNYVYGYRMCSYEMKKSRFLWNAWAKRHSDFVPHRAMAPQSCGFYNNFFIADLEFFTSDLVKNLLHSIKRQGAIYRRRFGDLLIHTMAVCSFAEPRRIHRFLDFTYEHGTIDETTGCLVWGGIQAGYNDTHALETVGNYYQTMLIDRNCTANATFLDAPNLSPTYSHLPSDLEDYLSLYTITAGEVELPGMGLFSG
jgi:alpha 1,2-mannosyltransferase